ncbi:restriction endonuclease subunit S [Kluyvera ascorbata]|uniref:restriction endonuclease subunit S n=1 Tax=Kluyvera ascorbata TaxID=51288 RepID=UPI0028DD4D1E|nr:restriction endonuclease subunit S [Kluyvera ascorbata]MDT8702729.1 restriction endonuclease subunit S [Kluyvera ascorbata]
MGSKWDKILLGDLIKQGHAILQTGPFGTALKAEEYTSNGVPLISVREIRNGYIKIEDITPRVNKDIINRLPKFVLKKGDIVFARKGGVDRTAYINEKESGWFLGSDGIYLRINDNYNSLFISYIMRSSVTRDWLIKNSEGTTMPSLNQKILSRIPLTIPSLQKQNIIAEFLHSLDRKINISNQINQTLEQMSQTLFKSWFVDFDPVIDNALDAGNPIPEALQSRAELRQKVRNSADFKPLPADIRALFPVEFEETELGWVPKGWITTSFNDLIELIGGGTPKTSVEEYWNGDIPWFSVVDAPNESDVYVLTTEKNITTEGLNNSSTKLLRKGTTIISARGTVGKCAMVAVPMAMNQSCYGVIGKNNISDEYIYFQLKNAVQVLQQMGHGSVFNTITRDTFKNIKIPFYNEELTNSYSLLVKNYFSKILNNNYQNIALTNLRDTLLPKLISGELSLEDLPDLVAQTEPA